MRKLAKFKLQLASLRVFCYNLLLKVGMYSVLSRVTRSLTCCRLLVPEKTILRRISILEKLKPKPSLVDKTNHKVIYEFQYISLPAGFLKTKYKLPIVCVAFISLSFYLNQPQMGALILVACVLQSILIFLVSKVAKNMIGKIYVNKKGNIDQVIISYIDSNGRRVDESFSPNQLCLSESVLTKYFGILDVETKTDDKTLKLHVRNPIIHDFKALKTVFADITLFLNPKYVLIAKKKSE